MFEDDQKLLRELAADFDARRPKVRVPQRIGDLVSRLMSRKGYSQQRSVAEWEDAWAQIVGPQISRQTQPGLLRRGVLDIFVTNSTLLQDLTFRKRELLHELAARLPAGKLRDLKFKVGPVSS